MTEADERFKLIAAKMKKEDLPEIAIETFHHYYKQLSEGRTGMIPESTIDPIDKLVDAETFGDDLREAGKAALNKTVVVNLNGGLGTSMGLDKAKSLLPVKNGLSFLDIIAHQAVHAGVPVLLMNSFATRDDSLTALKKYPELWEGLPLDFVQHKVPKLDQRDLSAVEWPDDHRLEWCPPGHGDIYTALVTSGMLDKLLEGGYRYAFMSNADNLGATLDEAILGYFASNNFPFMSESADRTEADRKGGHLARLKSDGHLILRETAQCPPEDEDKMQDVSLHKYFNTNNLWVNLEALKETMRQRDYILGLPMIRNAKTVDPRNPDSTPVYQLETAMAAAISAFDGATAIRVPRSRFAPVKTTDDLLGVRSDANILTEEHKVVPNPQRKLGTVFIKLDPRYYKHIGDFDARFPHGAPSLLECRRLVVKGDFLIGKDVKLIGHIELINGDDQQKIIPDGSVIQG